MVVAVQIQILATSIVHLSVRQTVIQTFGTLQPQRLTVVQVKPIRQLIITIRQQLVTAVMHGVQVQA